MVYRYPWLLQGFALAWYVPQAFQDGGLLRVKGLT